MEYSQRDRLLLRELSENSRATVTELSAKLGYPRYAITKMLKRIEEGLGIRFTLEVDSSALGASEKHLLAVKFLNKPNAKWLESILANEKNVQFAYATEGHFDLIIYAATTSAVEVHILGDPAHREALGIWGEGEGIGHPLLQLWLRAFR